MRGYFVTIAATSDAGERQSHDCSTVLWTRVAVTVDIVVAEIPGLARNDWPTAAGTSHAS